MPPLSAAEVEALGDVAPGLFSKKIQLAVLVAVGEHALDEPFTLTELADEIGVRASSIQDAVTVLATAGLIKRQQTTSAMRIKPYVRSDSAIWVFAQELRAAHSGSTR